MEWDGGIGENWVKCDVPSTTYHVQCAMCDVKGE